MFPPHAPTAPLARIPLYDRMATPKLEAFDGVEADAYTATRNFTSLKSSVYKLPGVRKTAVLFDGFLTADECTELVTDSYQACHGGFQRVHRAEQCGRVAGPCCAVGASEVRTQFGRDFTSRLWQRLLPLLPQR